MENKSYCYNCNKETNYEKIFKTEELVQTSLLKRNNDGDDKQCLYTIELHTIIICKCLGCGHLHIEHIFKNLDKKERIYTDPAQEEFKLKKFVEDLPIEYFKQFIQINKALNNKMYWLACMGIRTMLDTYMTSIVGDIGGFKKKIKEVKEKGYITEKQKELIETVIDAGNASAHRGYEPTKEVMEQIIQIIYNIFENTILDRNINKINKEVPKRNKE